MNNPSKLINKTEENFDKEFHHEGLSSSPKSNGKFTDKDAYYRVKSFLTKCIQESYEEGRKKDLEMDIMRVLMKLLN